MNVIFQIHPQGAVRISNVQEKWAAARVSAVGGAVLLVVHPTPAVIQSTEFDEWKLPAVEGGGVCFVSGDPVSLEPLLKVALGGKRWPERWYVLPTAVGEDAPTELAERFLAFLKGVALLPANGRLPWELLTPPTNDQNLLAIYLWLLVKAKCHSLGQWPSSLNDVWDSGVQAYGELEGAGLVAHKATPRWCDVHRGNAETCAAALNAIRLVWGRLPSIDAECEPFKTTNGNRHRLAHTWLKRQVIDVLQGQPHPTEQCDGSLFREFDPLPSWCAETRKLARTVDDAYSPRQLVDYGPLVALPSETKALIGSILHELYLSESGIAAKRIRIEQAAKMLELATAKLPKIRSCSPVAEWRTSIQEMMEAALELQAALESLPEGVVVP